MLGAPFNRDRINPIYKAGAVNFNAQMNASDVDARLKRLEVSAESIHGSRFNPYYDAPHGPHANSFRTLEVAEFAFRNRDFTNLEMQQNMHTPAAFDQNVGMAVMSTLNLLGDHDETISDEEMREAIMQRLQFVGIVVADNRGNNESHITLQAGGLMTVSYNGTKSGNAGDWLILEAPSRADIVNRQGGKDTAEEQDGGRVTLRLAPYDSRIHSHTPTYIYQALLLMQNDMGKARKRYLHSYLMQCRALYMSLCKIVAAGLIGLANANMLNAVNMDSIVSALCGTTVGKTPPPANQQTIRYAVRDAVFAAYRREKTGNGGVGVAAQAQEGIGLYMVSVADHVRTVLERVPCRALTAYTPKNDLDISFIQPAL